VPLQILNAPDSVTDQLRKALEGAFPGDAVDVKPGGAGHFEIRVVSRQFDGKSRVQQQQLVYKAIGHLLAGDAAPVHAIDRMDTQVP
jgi:acid stress-induced BolA-like protein IbaG/YrbA